MTNKILDKLIDDIMGNLKKAGFVVEYINYPENKRSIDIVGLHGQKRLMIKVTVDASYLSDLEVKDLKKASVAYSATPLVVSEKYRKKRMESDVVYRRKDLYIICTELLERYFLENDKPLVYDVQGNYVVKINPQKFRERRLELGYSLGELADKIGVSRKTIYEYERGNISVTVDKAIKIANIMGEDVFEEIDLLKQEIVQIIEEEIPRNKIEEILMEISKRKGTILYKLFRTPIDYVLRSGKYKISIINARRDYEKLKIKIKEAERITRLTRSKELIIRNPEDIRLIERHLLEE
ncbi:MAG: helix-turn-helix domain-containing protein [Staphylothermus sp.]|nr:helix-turn-helix domain-containing protein [Staphylothermus sp.]